MVAPALLLLLALPAQPSMGLSQRLCVPCCHPAWPPAAPGSFTPGSDREKWVQLPHVRPTIDISILKGECHREVAHPVPCPTGAPTLRDRREGPGEKGKARRPRFIRVALGRHLGPTASPGSLPLTAL